MGIVYDKAYNEGYDNGYQAARYALIHKAKEWMRNTLYIHTEIEEDRDFCEIYRTNWVTSDYDSVEDFINGFIKAIEE